MFIMGNLNLSRIRPNRAPVRKAEEGRAPRCRRSSVLTRARIGQHLRMKTRRTLAILHLGASLAAALPLACADRAKAVGAAEKEPEAYAFVETPAPLAVAKVAPWCGEGFAALDDGTCFVAPDRLADPPSIVFFAHGIMAQGAVPGAELSAVREAAAVHGFVAALPRGEPGLCAWSPEVATHLCWPTRRETVDAAAPRILRRFQAAEAQIAETRGVTFARRYLLGFSNGGYFAAYLGLEGLFAMDGVGVVGAGRTAIDESRLARRRPPFYVAVGEDEADFTQRDAEHLASVLSLRQWPVEYVVHYARGHALEADDLALAWVTWRSIAPP
jgi:predicted esterase